MCSIDNKKLSLFQELQFYHIIPVSDAERTRNETRKKKGIHCILNNVEDKKFKTFFAAVSNGNATTSLLSGSAAQERLIEWISRTTKAY